MPFERYLNEKEFKRLIEISELLELPKYRDALNSCFPQHFRTVLPFHETPKAQLVLDLVKLNRTFCIRHGEEPFIPLKAWLTEARLYDGGQHEGLELDVFAHKVSLVYFKHQGRFQQEHTDRIRDSLMENMRLLYMPFLTSDLMEINADASALARAIEKSIDRQFRYDRKFYIKNLCRTIEVSWSDANRQEIRVRDISEFEFVPFTHEQIVWRTQRFSSGELTATQYRFTRDKIRLKGAKLSKPKETTSANGQITTTIYTLPLLDAGTPYQVSTDRERGWYIDSDPTFEQTSPYVVDGGWVKIFNKAAGTRLVYHDVGGTELFLPENEVDRCTHNWDMIGFGKEISLLPEQVLLPGQGYMIVISRVSGN
ncbi:hypothetical protein GOL22_27320 [Sinorhizobium medicae]|nr:hypothetical protein [Sinorhizobium medicae]